ncbi:dihydrolipoyllysine-residue acetyltransferase [Exilibacterium tricleocarpae]|uniref:Acetyltransferase component of pyruvate dehydrogenase complex n=1 Tax=Exilibacterium tricleocarpae TaxID=2591008 RepID=A0A545UA12_9GAMM|nr:dihydrolipoyllysine-residue acetyltransferase [Exilibacterium tricleocarpae]TQV86300.1 dihydrolipoyllysine-residue acetyltransferase [Exilibacterium tricleocarpae]
MTTQVIPVPDIGGAENVDVIEVCVAPGDAVDAEQSLIVLESDKASMEVPSPVAGKVIALKVNEGDTVSEGDPIIELDVEGGETAPSASASASASASEAAAETSAAQSEPAAAEPEPAAPAAVQSEPESAPAPQAAATAEMPVAVPDIGGAEGVDVIEVCVAVGDEVAEGDSLIVLESDKASMEVPSPAAGKVLALSVNEGDQVSEGDAILTLAGTAAAPAPETEAAAPAPQQEAAPVPAPAPAPSGPPITEPAAPAPAPQAPSEPQGDDVYAGPSVRKLARQLGVDLAEVKASGPRNRHTKNDVRGYVKDMVARKPAPGAGGAGIPAVPAVDFAKFGDIELVKMSKIQKVTVASMVRSWLNVPHVTQFDEADISDLESFRKEMKAEAENRGVKLTPLPFLLKACAAALRHEPSFNTSLHADGEHMVQKHYVHIGVAVATPAGLLVPVIQNVDKKGLWELAAESAELAKKARDGKLLPRDMQGACFTVSSLGAIGGSGFTPIVNTPEVGILGVSKAEIKPVWNGSEFVPRQMLPLSLSYDHRAVNGADAGRFFTFLVSLLGDIRRLIL